MDGLGAWNEPAIGVWDSYQDGLDAWSGQETALDGNAGSDGWLFSSGCLASAESGWNKGAKGSGKKGKKGKDWSYGAYSGKSQGKGKGKGKGGKSKSNGKFKGKGGVWPKVADNVEKVNFQHPDYSWKSRLTEIFTKERNETPTKDTINYVSEKAENGWMCALFCDTFSNVYSCEDIMPSKKLAEADAARQAMKGEFPQVYEALPEAAKSSIERDVEEELNPNSAKKRAASVKKPPPVIPPTDSRGKDPKSTLNHGTQMLIGRSITTGDIVYSVEEQYGQLVAMVTLHCLADAPAYVGEPYRGHYNSKPDRKLAEALAAERALADLEALIAEAYSEHQAAKKAKLSDDRPFRKHGAQSVEETGGLEPGEGFAEEP
jgi:dsRNA-specific ribonuclease